MKYLCLISTTILIFLVLATKLVEASGINVNATVDLSICGNNIVEGGEDCEGSDLNNQTCESVGFGPGTLNCDIACSFDTSSCTAPSPTPTPTPTPDTTSDTSSGTSNQTSDTVSTTTVPPISLDSLINLISQIEFLPIPQTLLLYDPDGDGKIVVQEITPVVSAWVDSWYQSLQTAVEDRKPVVENCDLNSDEKCSLVDFSILLYFIGR